MRDSDVLYSRSGSDQALQFERESECEAAQSWPGSKNSPVIDEGHGRHPLDLTMDMAHHGQQLKYFYRYIH